MKCPKCKSEIGNQPVCPYCGSTVYIQGSVQMDQQYRPVMPKHYMNQQNKEAGNTEERLRNIETKLNVQLVLSCGNFILVVLLLIILALR